MPRSRLRSQTPGPAPGKRNAKSIKVAASELARRIQQRHRTSPRGVRHLGSTFEGWNGTGRRLLHRRRGMHSHHRRSQRSQTPRSAYPPSARWPWSSPAKAKSAQVPPGSSACGPLKGTCTAEFEWDVVTLTATPKAGSGYVFVGWLGCKKATATNVRNRRDRARRNHRRVPSRKAKKEPKRWGRPTGGPGPKGEQGKEEKASKVPGSGRPEGRAGRKRRHGRKRGQRPGGRAESRRSRRDRPRPRRQGRCSWQGRARDVQEGPGRRQRCTTKLVSGTVTFTTTGAAAQATLSRRGVVYAAGTAHTARGCMSLRLLPLRKLRAGRYTLTLVSVSGRHETIHSESFHTAVKSGRRRCAAERNAEIETVSCARPSVGLESSAMELHVVPGVRLPAGSREVNVGCRTCARVALTMSTRRGTRG